MPLIDSHCHLDAAEFDHDRAEVVARARAAGVRRILVPAVNRASFAQTIRMAHEFACPIALGLHPIYINSHQPDDLDALRALIPTCQPVAIGEIGLDFFVPGLDAQRQIDYFSTQLRIARDFDLPVLLHIRKAQDQVLGLLRRFGIRRGIAHAFNGSPQQAEAYIKQGFLLGFGGNISFDKAQNIRRLAANLPPEVLALETDAPDMAPSWAHKQRNEPAYLARIADILAELRHTTPEDIARTTSANVERILGLSAPHTRDNPGLS